MNQFLPFAFEDTVAEQSGDCLSLSNAHIRRIWQLGPHGPAALSLENLKTGFCWQAEANNGATPVFDLPGFPFHEAKLEVTAAKERAAFNGTELLAVQLNYHGKKQRVRFVFSIFPNIGTITTRVFVEGEPTQAARRESQSGEKNSVIESFDASQPTGTTAPDHAIDCIPHSHRHLIAKTFRYYDVTDHYDPVRIDQHMPLYDFRTQHHRGNVFVLEDPQSGEGLLMVKEGPTPQAHLNDPGFDLLTDGRAHLAVMVGSGLDTETLLPGQWQAAYGSTIGVGKADTLSSEYKRHYRAGCQHKTLETLCIQSNTWGDRNQDKAVCEPFMLGEIDAAATIGQTCVGIDDGWQMGVTINSARPGEERLWEGYHGGTVPFWNVNTDPARFPNGLEPILSAAQKKGELDLLLWFSPDSHNDFINAEKDLDVLLNLYRTLGIRHFKFDGIKIRSKQGETRLRWLMDQLAECSNGAITAMMDSTAEVRFGYFYERQHGLIFLENRYTDWGNYFPHRSLRNLWLLSEWLPTRRFQIEVLNPERNIDNYGDDPCAPIHCGLEYIYATALTAQPLLWTEVSNLSADQQATLRRMTDFHRRMDPVLSTANVQPIGDEPNGFGFTGFQIDAADGSTHLLVFREHSTQTAYEFALREPTRIEPSSPIHILHQSDRSESVHAELRNPNRVHVEFPAPATYAWISLNA